MASARRECRRRDRARVAGLAICVVGLTVAGCGGDDDDSDAGVPEEPTEDPPAANSDHWHAAFGANVCGEWMEAAPEFDYAAADPSQPAGLHSHGDGLIHIHPYFASESGANATVGRYLEYGGWGAGVDSFELWDGNRHANGDLCAGRPSSVRWEINGEPQSGDIAEYKPANNDVIALALLPEGVEIGEPPSAAELSSPSDVVPS